MSSVVIEPTSLSNHSNIRWVGEIGSGEMIIDKPNRLDGGVGTCVPECAVRMLQFIKKGWVEDIELVIEATEKAVMFQRVQDKSKVKKMKKQIKKTNNFTRKKQGGRLDRVAQDYIRHCLIFNKRTQQYIDTSNGRVMILAKDKYEEKRKFGKNYTMEVYFKKSLEDETDDEILTSIIQIINKKFREIYEWIEEECY
jgi:hypothetical protein